MRKALVVGIDHYSTFPRLHGCINGANMIYDVLWKHGIGDVNFAVKLLVGSSRRNLVSRAKLMDTVTELFEDDAEVALFYFAGYGRFDDRRGILLASDSPIALGRVLEIAGSSNARTKFIILDCSSRFSGYEGDAVRPELYLAEGGLNILQAFGESYWSQKVSSGLVTTLFVDALKGAAANLIGDVTFLSD